MNDVLNHISDDECSQTFARECTCNIRDIITPGSEIRKKGCLMFDEVVDEKA